MTVLEFAWHVSPTPLRSAIESGGLRPDPDFDGPDLWLWSTEERAREWAATFDAADVWRVNLDGVAHTHRPHIKDSEDVKVPGGVGVDAITLIDSLVGRETP